MVIKMDVVLPKQLEKLQPWTCELPLRRYAWISNEDIARILITFQRHADWLTDSRVHRPENGRLFMFNRKKVQYRKDMYIWKMRRKRKFPREDHVKLKIDGVPCISATYVHSDVLPSFHRRCYWFIQNPDIILVHYLNYPYLENDEQLTKDFTLNKNCQQWHDLTKDDVLQQILPMLANMPWPKLTGSPLTKEMTKVIANHLVQKHFESQAQDGYVTESNSQPRAIQPKIDIVVKRNISLPLLDGHKLLQSTPDVRAQGGLATSNQAIPNGNTYIILNQSPASNHTLPSAPLIVTPQNVALLRPENTVSSNHTAISLSAAVPPSYSNSHQQESLYKTGHDISSPLLSFAQHPSSIQCSPEPYKNMAAEASCGVNGNAERITPIAPNCVYNRFIDETQCYDNRKQAPSVNGASDTSPSHLESLAQADYGVKDVMLRELDGEVARSSTSNSELNLDDFDIDSLFNASNNLSPIELLADNTNPDHQTSVTDLFPEQLLDTGLREADSLLNLADHTSEAVPPSSQLDGSMLTWQASSLEAIADYSPDWSYTEGGVKVLVTGTWMGPGQYTCSFNDVCVPATVVQDGVLRCFCPPHSAGHVDLKVTRDGAIISHPVKFEYKPIPAPFGGLTSQWLQLNESSFKMSILERLERMEEKLNSMGELDTSHSSTSSTSYTLHYGLQVLHLGMKNLPSTSATPRHSSGFESQLTELCRHVSAAFNHHPCSNNFIDHNRHDGMTLLHYVAALGYSNLLRTLHMLSVTWRNSFTSHECNPRAGDQLACTPLMWASAVGHVDCVEILCGWDITAVHMHDVLGRSPLGVALQRGRMDVYNRLLQLSQLSPPTDDDVDTSSLGVSTASSIDETIDSGEDTMETDDNFSTVEASRDKELSNEATGQLADDVDDHVLSELEIVDTLLDGEEGGQCVAVLAEQIMEALPEERPAAEHMKREDDSPRLDLTLRSLPSYVNSRCGNESYDKFPDEPSSLHHRDYPLICRMNWMEFLQLPPRPPEPRYHPSEGELELESLRLTEYELRQLCIAARTVLSPCRRVSVPNSTDVIRASLVIQRCYRKYERFALCKKMNEAAVLIQSKFRSYQEQKRFQRSRHAAILIQSFYRSYKYTRGGQPSSKQTVKLIEDALRRHMTKKRQHQAARKIQRFLRQCQLRSRIMRTPPIQSRPTLRD